MRWILVVLFLISVWFVFWSIRLKHELPKWLRHTRPRGEEKEAEIFNERPLTPEMRLARKTYADVAKDRMLLMGTAVLFFGGGAYLLLGGNLMYMLMASLLGLPLGYLLHKSTLKSQAENARFEMWQAFSIFLSLVSMNLQGGASLPVAIRYAAKASDHWTFVQMRDLIPDANSGKLFGESLYEYAKEHGMSEIANRSLVLKTTEAEGGARVAPALMSETNSCRESVMRQVEEDMQSKIAASEGASVGVMLSLLIFIMYPVFTSTQTAQQNVGGVQSGGTELSATSQ